MATSEVFKSCGSYDVGERGARVIHVEGLFGWISTKKRAHLLVGIRQRRSLEAVTAVVIGELHEVDGGDRTSCGPSFKRGDETLGLGFVVDLFFKK